MDQNTGKKDSQTGTKALFGNVELESFRLKFEGYTYPEMEKELAKIFPGRVPSVSTLKKWFFKNGRMYHFYKDWAKEEAELRRAETLTTCAAYVKDAMRVLVALMKGSPMDMVRLAAAKEILNRNLGEPPKIIIDATESDLATDILAEAGLLDDDPTEDQQDG